MSDYLTAEQLARYLGISRSSAYRLARKLAGGRRALVGLRVSRAAVDAYMAAPPPAPRTAKPGTPVACGPDDDDEEVLPGLTRRQLKEQAGF